MKNMTRRFFRTYRYRSSLWDVHWSQTLVDSKSKLSTIENLKRAFLARRYFAETGEMCQEYEFEKGEDGSSPPKAQKKC